MTHWWWVEGCKPGEVPKDAATPEEIEQWKRERDRECNKSKKK